MNYPDKKSSGRYTGPSDRYDPWFYESMIHESDDPIQRFEDGRRDFRERRIDYNDKSDEWYNGYIWEKTIWRIVKYVKFLRKKAVKY